MKKTFTTALLIVLALNTANGVACNNSCRARMLRWNRPVYLFPTVTNTPLSPEIPVRDCKEVVSIMRKATSLLDRLIFEHKSLVNYIDYYAKSDTETLRRILPEVKRRQELILKLTEEAEKAAPKDLTVKDRVRTLRWDLTTQKIPTLRSYSKSSVEWAHLIVTEGNTPELTNSLPPSERPVLKGAIPSPSEAPNGAEKLDEKEIVQWQGPGPIELIQTLDPLEACMTEIHVLGSLLIDLTHKKWANSEEISRFYAHGPVILRLPNDPLIH